MATDIKSGNPHLTGVEKGIAIPKPRPTYIYIKTSSHGPSSSSFAHVIRVQNTKGHRRSGEKIALRRKNVHVLITEFRTASLEASNRLEDYMERLQPIRIGHIAMLKEVDFFRAIDIITKYGVSEEAESNQA